MDNDVLSENGPLMQLCKNVYVMNHFMKVEGYSHCPLLLLTKRCIVQVYSMMCKHNALGNKFRNFSQFHILAATPFLYSVAALNIFAFDFTL